MKSPVTKADMRGDGIPCDYCDDDAVLHTESDFYVCEECLEAHCLQFAPDKIHLADWLRKAKKEGAA